MYLPQVPSGWQNWSMCGQVPFVKPVPDPSTPSPLLHPKINKMEAINIEAER